MRVGKFLWAAPAALLLMMLIAACGDSQPIETATPVVDTVAERDAWLMRSNGFVAFGLDEVENVWMMDVHCLTSGIAVAMERVGGIYTEGAGGHSVPVTAAADGRTREETWLYVPREDQIRVQDYLLASNPGIVVGQLSDSETVKYSIPTDANPYIVNFETAGLVEHVPDPDDFC